MSNVPANPTQKRILIMAGGTGGHIFPAIAVAEKLKATGWDIHWLGTADRMEAQIVPAHGFKLHFVKVTGLRGRGIFAKIQSLIALFKAIIEAFKLIKELKPSVVLGMGGYASGPGGIAARLVGKPLLIHEQNVVLGLTNRWLAKFANVVMLGFDSARKQLPNNNNVVVTGNPVRKKIMTLTTSESVASISTLNILVVGGSLGAGPFNQHLPAILGQLNNVNVLHQCGKSNIAEVNAAYHQHVKSLDSDTQSKIEVTEFIDDMSHAYQWADIVICRAGAITVTEVALAGVAAIFIPLPHAVDDHQTANANSLVERRAAYLVRQADLPNKLIDLLSDIIAKPEQLKTVRLNALDCAISTGADKVAELCEKYGKNDMRSSPKGVAV